MKKRLFSIDLVLMILAVTSLVLAVALAIVRPNWLIAIMAVLLMLLAIIFLNVQKIRKLVAKVLQNANGNGSAGQTTMMHLQIPVVVLAGKNMVWYNDSFLQDVLQEQDAYLLPLQKIAPGLSLETATKKEGQLLNVNGKEYTCYGTSVEKTSDLYVIYFVNDTKLKNIAKEYVLSRPSVIHIVIDTYDEILKELKESDRARLTAGVDLELEAFIGKTTGFLKRISTSRYVAVVEDRHLQQIIESKFNILDSVRSLGSENSAVTLSIGVARGFDSFAESEAMAAQAIDMALGRGGDQAAIRTKDGYEFFGGVSRSVEKKTKVKSRIIASALKDLVMQSDSVLIMGHRMGDLDAIGAAVGVLRICKICDKPAAIVLNKERTLAGPLVEKLSRGGMEDELITAADALQNISKDTLLIVVDTHIAAMVESVEVYEACQHVVVIDHHRKMVGHIDDAVIFYLEPYASSASELVAEMLPYIGEREDKPTQLEAEALLAGIMLDTRNFSVRTGVRTFEAAAYLRRLGAQTAQVQKLFAAPQEVYAVKSQLVTMAQIYKKCAIVVTDEPLTTELSVVIPQAANDLLTIEGVNASIVAVPSDGQIVISARSLGDINVQVLMERLGGGGHLTMAGAQLEEISAEEVKDILFETIDEYFDKMK